MDEIFHDEGIDDKRVQQKQQSWPDLVFADGACGIRHLGTIEIDRVDDFVGEKRHEAFEVARTPGEVSQVECGSFLSERHTWRTQKYVMQTRKSTVGRQLMAIHRRLNIAERLHDEAKAQAAPQNKVGVHSRAAG